MFNVKRLRCFVGHLAFWLPWIVALILKEIPSSISATYYTHAGAVFMMILGSASVLLMFYDGYDKMDDILNTTAGIFGSMICLFPCFNSDLEKVGTFQTPVDISSAIHNISAVVFFALLAYISFFQFTKSNGNMTEKKKKRNVIYKVCGVGMILSFAILFFPKFRIQVWLTEMFALSFFGISWLTKANAYKWLFAD